MRGSTHTMVWNFASRSCLLSDTVTHFLVTILTSFKGNTSMARRFGQKVYRLNVEKGSSSSIGKSQQHPGVRQKNYKKRQRHHHQ